MVVRREAPEVSVWGCTNDGFMPNTPQQLAHPDGTGPVAALRERAESRGDGGGRAAARAARDPVPTPRVPRRPE
jgi:hypothetical protein